MVPENLSVNVEHCETDFQELKDEKISHDCQTISLTCAYNFLKINQYSMNTNYVIFECIASKRRSI